MSRVILVRFQTVLATGLLSLATVFSLPAISQEAEAEGEEPKSILVESTIVGDVDPSTAVTVDDLTVPIDQLELLVKPLTLEELQTESAAWFLLLRDKVQEITNTEVTIKRQNVAIEAQTTAAEAVTEAEAKLAEAEAKLEELEPGTPAHEAATKTLEEAKQALLEANQSVTAAVETVKDLEEDDALKETLKEAESEEEITKAREVLAEVEKEREALESGSDEYNEATEKIDALKEALLKVESAEQNLEGAVPGSEEFEELSTALARTRTQALAASSAIITLGLAPEASKADTTVESEDANEALEEIAENIEATQEGADQAIEGGSDSATEGEAAADDGESADETVAEDLEGVAETLENVAEAEADLKNQLVINVTELQGEQTAIIDRFNVVLTALEDKGGDVTSYRKYIDVVSGIELDLTDTEGLGVRLFSWLKSEEGGLRWGLNLAKFIGILAASVIVGQLVSKAIDRALEQWGGASDLFRGFIVMLIKRGLVVVGAGVALTSLGVSLGPVLALIGGASFVVAFALQSNLGNFASGLMLLISKPFDVGDEVKVAGYWAYVDSISLASTKLKDFDNNIITLPNNTVWGGDIINYTHAEERLLSIGIQIPFKQDFFKVKEIWEEVANAHPKVLKDKAPGFFPYNGTYEYYIWVGFNAWTKTDGFWNVYVDLLAGLQKRLIEEGIELAVPGQEIFFSDNQALNVKQVQMLSAASQTSAPKPSPSGINV